jgi:hypothetical protein
MTKFTKILSAAAGAVATGVASVASEQLAKNSEKVETIKLKAKNDIKSQVHKRTINHIEGKVIETVGRGGSGASKLIDVVEARIVKSTTETIEKAKKDRNNAPAVKDSQVASAILDEQKVRDEAEATIKRAKKIRKQARATAEATRARIAQGTVAAQNVSKTVGEKAKKKV